VDYLETKGTLTFAAGETFKTLSVPISRNLTSEFDLQFMLTLTNPTAGAVLGANSSATVTILDMTGVVPHGFSDISVSVEQGTTLTLSGNPHRRFAAFFDVYPVEVSTDLVKLLAGTLFGGTHFTG
jgi:hypothetical protein